MHHRYTAAAICVLVLSASTAAAPAPAAAQDGSEGRAATPLLAPSRFAGVTDALEARVGLDRRLAKATAGAELSDSCVQVETPEGEVLFDLRGSGAFIPASATKLFTAVAALAELGETARFRTEVWEQDGTLYLKGGGDPVLATPAWMAARPDHVATPLADLARRAREARPGATSIVADAGYLDTAPEVEGWEARYARDAISPRISALSVDRTRPTPAPDWPKVPHGKADADLETAAAFAALYGAEDASVTRGSVPEGAAMVASVESPPLSEIVAEMNKHSDNAVAEIVLRQVGKHRTGDGSTAGGLDAVAVVLAELGVPLAGVTLRDGSGLHRESRATCSAFLELLARGIEDAGFGRAFSASLAVGGGDGTLDRRGLDDTVRAKTGTLNDVSNLVGVTGSGAGDVYFAILMNDLAGSGRAHQIQDRIVEEVAAWPAP